MDKTLFNTRTGNVPAADTKNHAGGKAYSRSAQEALAQLSVTGCFGDTYYASATDQLAEAKKVLGENTPEFIAKCAIYARERGNMKDMPAFMLAYLTAVFQPKGYDENGARRAFRAAFPRVIDNGKMLANFTQVVRSGAVGRKSFGTTVRNTMRRWLLSRSDYQIFKDQVGQNPSLADIIKMVRPNPGKGSQRWALHQYLLNKPLTDEHNAVMPQVVRDYERFKSAQTAEALKNNVVVPAVDFRLLDGLQLSDAQWKEVFRRAPWSMTRMNLNTAKRHAVLDDPEMVKLIADRLRNPELVRKSRDFPFALLAAFIATNDQLDMPHEISEALQDAMEVAVEKVPALGEGVVICPDVSGSMSSTYVTGARKKPTTIRCVDAAALITAALVRKNPGALVLPFSDRLNLEYKCNPRDSIMTIAQQIAALPSGGTDCSLPLAHLNGANSRNWAAVGIKNVFIISDNESWLDKRRQYYNYRWDQQQGTSVAQEWAKMRARNKDAKLFCIDLTPDTTVQVQSGTNRLNVGGFSDDAWRIFERFSERGSGTSWIDEIDSIDLDARAREA